MTAELKVIFFEGAKLLRVKIGVHFSGYSRVLKTTSNARKRCPTPPALIHLILLAFFLVVLAAGSTIKYTSHLVLGRLDRLPVGV